MALARWKVHNHQSTVFSLTLLTDDTAFAVHYVWDIIYVCVEYTIQYYTRLNLPVVHDRNLQHQAL